LSRNSLFSSCVSGSRGARPEEDSKVVVSEGTVLSPLSRNSLFSSCVSGSRGAQPEEDSKAVVSDCTPAKYASTPVRLMASTPDLKTPKRPIFAAGCGTPPLTMAKKTARAKLFTTPTKVASSMVGENQNASISSVDSDDELLSFLPQSLLQSVCPCQ
jgi:chromatin licensing and DNA replication factor 1